MSNKIDGFGSRPAAVPGGHRGGAIERSDDTGQPSATGTSSDSVTLTDAAVRLQKLARAVADAPAADAGRIATVKETINRGEYRINADRIADRILQAERELVGR